MRFHQLREPEGRRRLGRRLRRPYPPLQTRNRATHQLPNALRIVEGLINAVHPTVFDHCAL